MPSVFFLHNHESTSKKLKKTFLIFQIRSWYTRKFPPQRRLLSNEEYFEEGVRETAAALDQLREYARSPDCKQWRIVQKLKDPMRFAAFIEGESHLTDSEMLSYEVDRDDESSAHTSEISEDEEEIDEEEEVDTHVKGNGTYVNTPNGRRSRNSSRRY